MNATERITIEPGKRGGKPCIRGLRITVDDVLSYLASGMTEAEILADFPDLEHEDYLAVYASRRIESGGSSRIRPRSRRHARPFAFDAGP